MVVGIEPKWCHVCHLGGCVSMGSFKPNGFTFWGPRSQRLALLPLSPGPPRVCSACVKLG